MDPSRFDDPVAMKTAWTPAKGGGANFKTHVLVETGPQRLEFRASAGARLFYGVFLLAGLAVMASVLARPSRGLDLYAPLGFGFLFAVLGGVLLYYGARPAVFDLRKGLYWKGRRGPERGFRIRSLPEGAVELREVHALQLIAEWIPGDSDSSPYHSYELNLVLTDGRRINVVDHGNREVLLKDAETLSRLLGKPVWNAL